MANKYAYIRTNTDRRCPFGLPITQACENAGTSVLQMAPLYDDEDSETIEKTNKRIYVYQKTGSRCVFAEDIMEDQNAVNCDWGDNAEGLHHVVPPSVSYYPRLFNNSDLYSYPTYTYYDRPNYGGFYSLFPLLGENEVGMLKIALKNTDEMLYTKIEDRNNLDEDDRKKLGEFLDKYKESK